MDRLKIHAFVLLISISFNFSMVRAQNLDSLLKNKRVYQTVNIGDLPLPKIDGLLDDEIWELGEPSNNLMGVQKVLRTPI